MTSLMTSPTQKDVARLAGVSQATVSLVLSGDTSISIPAETIARVQKAVVELAYTPNRYAQALRTNKSKTLLCVVPDIENPFYPPMVRGVQTVAEQFGYDLIIVNSDGQKNGNCIT